MNLALDPNWVNFEWEMKIGLENWSKLSKCIGSSFLMLYTDYDFGESVTPEK